MRKNLISVLDYFAYFSYAPSLREIHTFYPERISIKNLSDLLNVACENGRLVRLSNNNAFSLSRSPSKHYSLITSHSRYTLPQYSIPTPLKLRGAGLIKNKKPVWTIQIYLFLLKYLPFVRFVGITGATAMSGFTPHDDVDLFIITKGGMIWSSRLCTVVLAKILRIHGGTGVCLNMFFDEDGLSIPKMKQNKYIAHELLQMKPLIDKTSTYSLLIQANLWVFDFFPNAQTQHAKRVTQNVTRYTLYEYVEQFLKSIQIPLIKRNKTDFLIGEHQLWLFKKDFERSLRKKYRL